VGLALAREVQGHRRGRGHGVKQRPTGLSVTPP
jgi:hypothetical protein